MHVVRVPWKIVRENLRAYLLLNVGAYGMLGVGLGIGVLFPDLNAARTETLTNDGTADLVVSLLQTPWLFALVIMAVNVGKIAIGAITVPSLVVPFLGVPVFGYFAVETGITLAPVSHATTVALIPHSVTMLVEFQAYVLLLLGAVVLGRAWLWPATVGAQTRRQGYLVGLRRLGWLAIPAGVLFVVGAVYEALSLTYIVPLLLR